MLIIFLCKFFSNDDDDLYLDDDLHLYDVSLPFCGDFCDLCDDGFLHLYYDEIHDGSYLHDANYACLFLCLFFAQFFLLFSFPSVEFTNF